METYRTRWIIRDDYLMHHGIKGQKWGVRRYQNEDGSLTPEGLKRYGVEDIYYQSMSGNRKSINRKQYIKNVKNVAKNEIKSGRNRKEVISEKKKAIDTINFYSRDDIKNEKKRKAIGTAGALSGAIVGAAIPTAVSLALDSLTKGKRGNMSMTEDLLVSAGSAAVGSAIGRIGAQKIYDLNNKRR